MATKPKCEFCNDTGTHTYAVMGTGRQKREYVKQPCAACQVEQITRRIVRQCARIDSLDKRMEALFSNIARIGCMAEQAPVQFKKLEAKIRRLCLVMGLNPD